LNLRRGDERKGQHETGKNPTLHAPPAAMVF
jgi:hypothetical protein